VIPWAMNKHLLRVSQVGTLPEEIRLRPKTQVPRDPLLLHAASRRWDPVPSDAPAAGLASSVNWSKVLDPLHRQLDRSVYIHLRPVALSRWLNAVDCHNRIQYSRDGISSYDHKT